MLFPDIRFIHAYVKIFTSITETPLGGLRRRVNYIYILFYSHNCDNTHLGLSMWCSGEAFPCQCRRHNRGGFNPWVGKIPWSKKWQPTPVFLPGKFHEQRSLACYIVHGVAKSQIGLSYRAHTHESPTQVKKQNYQHPRSPPPPPNAAFQFLS